MDLIALLIYVIWFTSEILINRLTRSKNHSPDNTDKNSLSIIWITIVIGVTAAVFISMNHSFPILSNAVVIYAGLAIILLGIIARVAIIKSLGAFFTADVNISEHHLLKTNGVYKLLRHPSYFASLISFIGFGLSLNNWLSLFIITFSVLGAFAYRIKVEEIALTRHFGQQYIDYKKSAKGLIPFIY